MARYRCYNADCAATPGGPLGFDFPADKPVCPKCKHDGASADFADLVVQLVDVHFMVSDPSGPIISRNMGKRRVVCDPTYAHPDGKTVSLTGDPAAVTCEKCLASPECVAAKANVVKSNEIGGPAKPAVGMKLAKGIDAPPVADAVEAAPPVAK